MKTRKIFYLMLCLFAVTFVACSSDDDDDNNGGGTTVTGITLNQNTLSVAVEASATLKATLAPEGSSGTVEWSSSAPSVASVNNGVVIGLKEGTAIIAATYGGFTATCNVTVTKKPSTSDHPSLKGSNYYLMILDATSETKVAGKIAQDYRPDDVNKFLYVWDETFAGNSTTGLNFYGEAEGWTSFSVTNIGWSGAGYAVNEGFGGVDLRPVTANINDYYFHVALKSGQPNTTFTFILYGEGVEAKLVIGSEAVDGVQPYKNFPRDNEWHEIEVPMTYFQDLGLYYRNVIASTNVVAFLAGGTSGTTIDMDAMFIYKKAQ